MATAPLPAPRSPPRASARIAGQLPGDLGIEPIEIEDEPRRGHIVVDARHLHPGGFVHGGAWSALGDTVAAWSTFRNLPPGHDFTTIELKLNVFAAGVPGDEIIATGEHLHVGRSTDVIEVRVHRGDRLVAQPAGDAAGPGPAPMLGAGPVADRAVVVEVGEPPEQRAQRLDLLLAEALAHQPFDLREMGR